MTNKNFPETYYPTLTEVPWLLTLKKSKKQQKFSKNLKKSKFQKIAKICDIKKLKTSLRMFSGPWVWNDLNKDKKRQKFEKIARFVKKCKNLWC